MKRWYFAYGMNTNLREMSQRCPGAICHGLVILPDHKFVFRLHADVEKSPGNYVEGVLWELTEDCEKALDILEGYPHYYLKKQVIVESVQDRPDGQDRFVAMVYHMREQSGTQHPGSIYLSCLNEGYVDNGLNVYQLKRALEECQQNEKIP